jgi:hypothetical protein
MTAWYQLGKIRIRPGGQEGIRVRIHNREEDTAADNPQ